MQGNMKENIQADICDWAERAFGPVSDPLALYHRAQLEMTELLGCLRAGEDKKLVSGEL